MDTITAETCVCGSTHWHTLVHTGVLWCGRCGALRIVFSERWNIPLDRAGDVSHTKQRAPDEPPTSPGFRTTTSGGIKTKPGLKKE